MSDSGVISPCPLTRVTLKSLLLCLHLLSLAPRLHPFSHNHCRSLSLFLFHAPSQSIDPGQQFTWENSNMEVNKPKNRYANVIAYDHSRVVLTSVDGKSSWSHLTPQIAVEAADQLRPTLNVPRAFCCFCSSCFKNSFTHEPPTYPFMAQYVLLIIKCKLGSPRRHRSMCSK